MVMEWKVKGRPRKRWREVLKEDMRKKGLCREDAWNRSRWRRMLWEGQRGGWPQYTGKNNLVKINGCCCCSYRWTEFDTVLSCSPQKFHIHQKPACWFKGDSFSPLSKAMIKAVNSPALLVWPWISWFYLSGLCWYCWLPWSSCDHDPASLQSQVLNDLS